MRQPQDTSVELGAMDLLCKCGDQGKVRVSLKCWERSIEVSPQFNRRNRAVHITFTSQTYEWHYGTEELLQHTVPVERYPLDAHCRTLTLTANTPNFTGRYLGSTTWRILHKSNWAGNQSQLPSILFGFRGAYAWLSNEITNFRIRKIRIHMFCNLIGGFKVSEL